MAKIPVPTKLDSKQVDRLMKLIRLANHNSAENEANSAARQVCKILDGYVFKPDVIPPVPPKNPVPPKQPNTWEGFKPSPAQEKYYEAGFGDSFWEDAFGGGFNPRRKQGRESYPNNPPGREPPGSKKEAKQAPPETEAKPHQDFRSGKQNDPYSDFKEAYAKATSEQWPFNFTSMSDEEFLKFVRMQREQEGKSKRKLQCNKCRKDFETGFVGHPGAFTCPECHFKRGL